MYIRKYRLVCTEGPKMKRFKVVTTQNLSFSQMMRRYNIPTSGLINVVDDHFDDELWEITSEWESKEAFEKSQQHPYRKMFWTRFELECHRHGIRFFITDGDTGEETEPFSFD